jgi:hypothetical protein
MAENFERSSPLPQLLPCLDEHLHLPRTRQAVVDKPAILEGAFVEIADASGAQVCEILPQLLEILLTQNIRFLAVGTPGHSDRCLAYSPYLRPSVQSIKPLKEGKKPKSKSRSSCPLKRKRYVVFEHRNVGIMESKRKPHPFGPGENRISTIIASSHGRQREYPPQSKTSGQAESVCRSKRSARGNKVAAIVAYSLGDAVNLIS